MPFLSIFRNGLKKTATALSRNIGSLFIRMEKWDESSFRTIENALIAADTGLENAREITAKLKERYELGELNGKDDVREAAAVIVRDMLQQGTRSLHWNPDGPTVLLFAGVNGSGKTTTIGKLACHFRAEGKKVLLAACDTFRAAAREQLELWGERAGSPVISSNPGSDPASVAFDAVQSAIAKNMDVLLIDTAGRQQNKKGLMEELAKLRRIVAKKLPGAPHETLLTLDASLGLNALSQAREFIASCGASALILTKLDGSGKGGAACAVQREFLLPVLFAGLGENPEDLQTFSPEIYARALFGLPPSATPGHTGTT